MATTISRVHARRIWDSRGRPTVEVDVLLADGGMGRGVAPAGASRGLHEAIELRDGGDRLGGQDVRNAIAAVNSRIAERLIGMDATDQAAIDRALIDLDGTKNMAVLGGNATTATSLAVLHAAAAAAGTPLWAYLAGNGPASLPLPEIQIFGGGAHAGRRVDIQDFLIMPAGAQSFEEAMEMTSAVYHAAGRIMADRNTLAGVADEGGFWPSFGSNEEALDTLALAINRSGLRDGDVLISLDIAASEFHRDGSYVLALEDSHYSTDEWIEHLESWVRRYPIVSIEDPVGQTDTAGMVAFTRRLGGKIQIIGDDFLVTDAQRVEAAVGDGACNAVLVKVNQVGTVTEAHRALSAAKAHGWGTIVSARSGETEDVAIAHLAIGWNAGQLKVGSFTRSERMAKWNEVLRVEELAKGKLAYVGIDALPTYHGRAR